MLSCSVADATSPMFVLINSSTAGICAPILPGSQVVMLAVGKKKNCLDCQCPSQLFPFPSIVLKVFENDAVKGNT